MSVLVVGLSHRSAPVSLLERASVVGDDLSGLLLRATDAPHVGEAVVVSTCNRVELYAVVDKFHGGVEDLTGLLAEHAGIPMDELTPHLYVHYDERTVQHLFSVVCGLDSMVVGEAQVLGQARSALRVAQETGAAGTLLNDLFQNALRVGKRVHAETGIDRTGSAVVQLGLERAAAAIGGLGGARVLLIGAGSMGSIVASALVDSGIAWEPRSPTAPSSTAPASPPPSTAFPSRSTTCRPPSPSPTWWCRAPARRGTWSPSMPRAPPRLRVRAARGRCSTWRSRATSTRESPTSSR